MTKDDLISIAVIEAIQSAPDFILSEAESDLRMAALQEKCIQENTTLIDGIANMISIQG